MCLFLGTCISPELLTSQFFLRSSPPQTLLGTETLPNCLLNTNEAEVAGCDFSSLFITVFFSYLYKLESRDYYTMREILITD